MNAYKIQKLWGVEIAVDYRWHHHAEYSCSNFLCGQKINLERLFGAEMLDKRYRLPHFSKIAKIINKDLNKHAGHNWANHAIARIRAVKDGQEVPKASFEVGRNDCHWTTIFEGLGAIYATAQGWKPEQFK